MFSFGLKVLTSLIFPAYCTRCRGEMAMEDVWLCNDCWAKLPRARYGSWNGDELLNRNITTCYRYDDAMRDIIRNMKFGGRQDLAGQLGIKAAKIARGNLRNFRFSAVIPIPLHPVRIRERGYDQSYLIAEQVAKSLNVPFRPDIIRRIRNTTPQSRLSDKERMTNLIGAFEPAKGSEVLPDGTVLLVDDVIHTGSTARECIKVLNELGVGLIYVLAVAG